VPHLYCRGVIDHTCIFISVEVEAAATGTNRGDRPAREGDAYLFTSAYLLVPETRHTPARVSDVCRQSSESAMQVLGGATITVSGRYIRVTPSCCSFALHLFLLVHTDPLPYSETKL
jgi:hypothetical protein